MDVCVTDRPYVPPYMGRMKTGSGVGIEALGSPICILFFSQKGEKWKNHKSIDEKKNRAHNHRSFFPSPPIRSRGLTDGRTCLGPGGKAALEDHLGLGPEEGGAPQHQVRPLPHLRGRLSCVGIEKGRCVCTCVRFFLGGGCNRSLSPHNKHTHAYTHTHTTTKSHATYLDRSDEVAHAVRHSRVDGVFSYVAAGAPVVRRDARRGPRPRGSVRGLVLLGCCCGGLVVW